VTVGRKIAKRTLPCTFRIWKVFICWSCRCNRHFTY